MLQKIWLFIKENWLLIFSLLYLVFPFDLVTDVAPLIGMSDDLALLALTYFRYWREANQADETTPTPQTWLKQKLLSKKLLKKFAVIIILLLLIINLCAVVTGLTVWQLLTK